MKKNYNFRFIFPPDKEGKEKCRQNIQQFYDDIIITYINNLNCGYQQKMYVLEQFSTIFKQEDSG